MYVLILPVLRRDLLSGLGVGGDGNLRNQVEGRRRRGLKRMTGKGVHFRLQ